MNNRCLYCYKELTEENFGYHPACSRKFFTTTVPPVLDYSNDEMVHLAQKVVQSHITVTGVQPKLSLGHKLSSDKNVPSKLTIVGVWPDYILKPPTEFYPNLPELEDLTMHLAELAGIKTVPHTLIRLKSGELAYLTKRIDRKGKQKIHMEDMCQLTEKLTEFKYKGLYEQIGKVVGKYSENPVLDIVAYFEQVVFCFLTGNNDMHLKNFSLIKKVGGGYNLSSAYDMVASELVVEGDDEELALTLNGKKKKIKFSDFEVAMSRFEVNERAFKNIFNRFVKALPKWQEFIEESFLPEDMKEAYQEMLVKKFKQLGLTE
ncbi:HipA domain-containing protein [Cytophagaceae bacterium ABcell3]|nr:HipA domain-containing protein [Cytophagaceae bacterium ABcell3]